MGSPVVPVPEEGEYFFEGLVLGLRDLLVREYPEDGQQHAERKERVVFESSLETEKSDLVCVRYTVTWSQNARGYVTRFN